jgi:hypothetical protein
VGYNACYNVTSGSYKTCIGIGAGPTSIEDDKTSDANQVWIGVSNSTVYIPGSLYVGGTQVTSDKRLKNIKSENTSGLEKIKQIKVFNYTLKDDKAKTPRVGVIAQDLQKIFPDAVSKGSGGFLAVRTEDILYALVNAVKELDKKINDVIASVKNDVAGVRNDIATLKKENKELKEQNKMLKQVQDDMARVQNDILKQNKALEAKLLKLENKK